MKLCGRCKEHKELTEFYKDSSRPDGLTYRCRECMKVTNRKYAETEKGRETARKSSSKWRDGNLEFARRLSKESNQYYRKNEPERFKDYDRKRHYGVSYGWYAEQLKKQAGKCAICGATEPSGNGGFHIDHCHETNKVRGLLCYNCNVGLGQFKHSVEILNKAIQYLHGNSS